MSNETCRFHEILQDSTFQMYITSFITCVLNSVLSISAVIGNFLVIAAIASSRELHTTSNILLLCLAISDLGVGLIAQPLFILAYVNILRRDQACLMVSMELYIGIGMSLGGFSLLTLVLVSVERYLSIFHSFKHKIYCTSQRVLAATFFTWFVVTLIITSRFLGIRLSSYYTLLSVIIVTSMLVIAALYIRVFRVAWKHKMEIRRQRQSVERQEQPQASLRDREMKTSRTMAIIITTLLSCYIPHVGSMLTIPFLDSDQWEELLFTLFPWTETVIFLNSSLNPLVYCWRSEPIRKRVLWLLGRRTPRVGPDSSYRVEMGEITNAQNN